MFQPEMDTGAICDWDLQFALNSFVNTFSKVRDIAVIESGH